MSYQILRCYVAIIACSLLVLVAGLMLIFKGWFPKFRLLLLKHEKKTVSLILIFGLLGYIVSIIGYFGVEKYVKDFDVFLMWSKQMLDSGFKGFMTEYPPVGLYVLALLQFFLRIFGLGDHYIAASLLMKLPAMISILGISFLVYLWAKKETAGVKPILLMALFAFNPAFLINAAMWGQMDMVMVFFAILSLYYLKQKRLIPTIIYYTAGCLVKPQMIFLAPVFGVFVLIYALDKEFRAKSLKELAFGVAISVVGFFLVTLPFKESFFQIWIVDFFKHIATEHPVNTASAFNLFGLHGGSFIPYTERFLFMDYRIWGYIFIGLVCIASAYLCIKDKNKGHVFMLGAFCVTAVFTLGLSMHERYILLALALLCVAAVYSQKKIPIIHILAYTLIGTINQCIILFDLFGGKTWTFRLFSGISVAVFASFAVYVFYVVLKKSKIEMEKDNE